MANPKVSDLISESESGTVVLPDFQRSFIWEPERIRELLVSVLGNYFLGTLLILQQFSDDSPFALRLVEGVKQLNDSAQIQSFVKVLLDGQQRTTSLFYALSEPDISLKGTSSSYRFYLDFDKALKSDWDGAVSVVNVKDKKRLAEVSKNPRIVPFRALRNLKDITTRFKMDTQFEEIYAVASDFLNREIYTIELSKDTSPERIVETFERINRTGKPLTAFELLTARLYKSKIKLRDLLDDAKDSYTFSQQIEPDFITKVIAMQRGKEPKRKFVLELDPANFAEDWDRACEALEDAYTRLLDIKNGYGAFDFKKWVPYSTMIVPLACMLGHLKENKQESKKNYDKIDRWYWASVFQNRYDQAADTTSFTDFSAIKNWINDDNAVPNFVANFDPISLDWSVEKQSSAIYRGVLNLIVLKGALDFQTGQPLQFDVKNVQDDHIFPKSVYKVNIFPNRSLITKNLPKLDRIPSDYFKEQLNLHGEEQLIQILNSHLIPKEAISSLLSDDLTEFVKLRAFTIINELRSRLFLPSLPYENFTLEAPKRSYAKPIESEQEEEDADEDRDSKKTSSSWNERLEWTNNKDLVTKFLAEVNKLSSQIVGRPQGPWYRIYAREPVSGDNFFAVIMLGKNTLHVCLKFPAGTLNDPSNISYPVKNWFFGEGKERRIKLTVENFDSALDLTKQSLLALTSSQRAPTIET
jgi:hypothetical protein